MALRERIFLCEEFLILAEIAQILFRQLRLRGPRHPGEKRFESLRNGGGLAGGILVPTAMEAEQEIGQGGDLAGERIVRSGESRKPAGEMGKLACFSSAQHLGQMSQFHRYDLGIDGECSKDVAICNLRAVIRHQLSTNGGNLIARARR